MKSKKKLKLPTSKKLTDRKCLRCGERMILERSDEYKPNRICSFYTCSGCGVFETSSEIKQKEKVTLTREQLNDLYYHLASIQEVLCKAEREEGS